MIYPANYNMNFKHILSLVRETNVTSSLNSLGTIDRANGGHNYHFLVFEIKMLHLRV